MALRVVRPGESEPRTSNQLALVIGPEITTVLPINVMLDGAGTATIPLDFQPLVQPGQQVSLLVGTREIAAEPIEAATGTLSFVVDDAPADDPFLFLRLRVDGVESPIIDRLAVTPVYFNFRVNIT